MGKPLELTNQITVVLKPKPPFHFKGTVHNPSHFPTPTEVYKPDFWWQATRVLGLLLGFKKAD